MFHLLAALVLTGCNDLAPLDQVDVDTLKPAPIPSSTGTEGTTCDTTDDGGGYSCGGETEEPDDVTHGSSGPPPADDPPADDPPADDPSDPDDDDDGVDDGADCEPLDARVGRLLYETPFTAPDSYLANSATLLDPWTFLDDTISTAGYGQQAYIGPDETWADTVTYTTVWGDRAFKGCEGCGDPTERYRAGVLARVHEDLDQDEGYHGYRCAVAENAGDDCFEPGPHLQIAAFLDVAEDDLSFECDGNCPPNTSFDQLDRVNRDERTDLLVGDKADLAFWVVGNQLTCEMWGEGGDYWRAEAVDERMVDGGTGLSVLNLAATYEYLKVCEAFATP